MSRPQKAPDLHAPDPQDRAIYAFLAYCPIFPFYLFVWLFLAFFDWACDVLDVGSP